MQGSPIHADHDGMRRFSPFPATRRHELAEDGEQEGRHGSDLGPISTIVAVGHQPFSIARARTRSSPPCSATPQTDAAIEAPEQSVSSVLMMGEGGAPARIAHLTCAHHISLRSGQGTARPLRVHSHPTFAQSRVR